MSRVLKAAGLARRATALLGASIVMLPELLSAQEEHVPSGADLFNPLGSSGAVPTSSPGLGQSAASGSLAQSVVLPLSARTVLRVGLSVGTE